MRIFAKIYLEASLVNGMVLSHFIVGPGKWLNIDLYIKLKINNNGKLLTLSVVIVSPFANMSTFR
jgi:hypothetical protein